MLPAYNEASAIGSTLDDLLGLLDSGPLSFELIVCAEGEDDTRACAGERAARDARVRVSGGPQRRGKGRAVREGVGQAAGRTIGFMDADGKTPARELLRLLSWIDAGWDVVIGSRFAPGACVERPARLHRRLGTLAFTKAVHLLLGLRQIRDLQCGLKLFRGEVARELFARQRIDGYLFDLELLLLAARAGYRIKEVGVHWRDDGDSRFRPLRGGLGILADLTRLRLGGR